MNESISSVLELKIILEKISESAVSEEGKNSIIQLQPFTNKEKLQQVLNQVTELKNLMTFDDPFPFHGFNNLRPVLKKIEVAGSFLQPDQFLSLLNFLSLSRQIKLYFMEREEKYCNLQVIVQSVTNLHALEQRIQEIIDSSGLVKDNASPVLLAIRRDIMSKESQVKKKLDSILRSLISSGGAQEDNVVLKSGRLVIPVKETHRGRLKGVVVDQSASGATVFVEPLEVLELNNVIHRLKSQEQREIEKILISLTDETRIHLHDIFQNITAMEKIDSLRARALFSIKTNCCPAGIEEDGVIHLKNAYHPLLLMREKREQVVPLTLQLGKILRTIVITGPNAGGKTVALKTVGLLSLMHQHGLHVTASEGTVIPLFSNVFADIGDRQSIEQDLSTFSSHVQNLKCILENAKENDLILLDEIGSATDPTEGAALAETVLRNLTERGCLTIATTHMGSLKVFAHEEPGVENGSMVFDQKTLRPTFHFQLGIPGSSYAFEIAERLGISPKIIQDARQHVGEERGKLDQLILHLESDLQRSRKLLSEAEIKESKLEGLVQLYRERMKTIQKEGEEKKQKILEEAESVLKEVNAVVENVVREIKESGARKEAIRSVKEKLQKQKKRVKSLSKKPEQQTNRPVHIGNVVRWKGQKSKGTVLSEPDRSGKIRIELNGIKLQVSSSELEVLDVPAKAKTKKGNTFYKIDRQVRDEVDLRGMAADEAIETVEQYLGDAALTGFSRVRIIHGKGTGVLRREIGNFLKNHKQVKSYRLGNWNEGDTGVTIVEIK